jgi:hypothetical protein
MVLKTGLILPTPASSPGATCMTTSLFATACRRACSTASGEAAIRDAGEPPRLCRRLFSLSPTFMVGSSCLSQYIASSSAGGMSAIGSSSRRWLNQSTQSSVANSTSARLRHGPRCTSVELSDIQRSSLRDSFHSLSKPRSGENFRRVRRRISRTSASLDCLFWFAISTRSVGPQAPECVRWPVGMLAESRIAGGLNWTRRAGSSSDQATELVGLVKSRVKF